MRQLCHPSKKHVLMPNAGRFGFVEMRTEELSHHAMNLDKVELCNRHVNVGRPKGYVESAAAPPPAAIGAAAAFAAQLGSEPSTVLRLDSMVKARLLLDARERSDVRAWSLFTQMRIRNCVVFPVDHFIICHIAGPVSTGGMQLCLAACQQFIPRRKPRRNTA